MALINCPECNKEISDKAGTCPQCGLPLDIKKTETPVDTFHDPNEKSCPSCKSENTQSIKMMCLNGTSSGSSTGVGVSSDLDVGVGRISSNSQTKLAKKFTPGASPDSLLNGCGCLLLIVGSLSLFVFLNSSGFGSEIAICFGIPALIIGVVIKRKLRKSTTQQTEWESKAMLYEKGWICHKCGNTWFPSDSDVRSNLKSQKSPDVFNAIFDKIYDYFTKNPSYIFLVIFFLILLITIIRA